RENGNRHLGSLHFLYQQEPSGTDIHFVQVRQWLTAEDEYSDFVGAHGQTDEMGDLQTEIEALSFFLSTEQALERINGRKGKKTTRIKSADRTTWFHRYPCRQWTRLDSNPQAEASQPLSGCQPKNQDSHPKCQSTGG
ncbi:MAG: hypothetical protein WA996_22350, partial [Candidatus Promineifilaceae bacterium]